MIKSFFGNKKWAIWAWGGLLFLLASLYAQVQMTVMFNEWYKGFYDILQGSDTGKYAVGDFWSAIIEWCHIAYKYILLSAVTAYFTRLYAFTWREAMTFDYLPRWEHVEEQIEGAAQRIQQDTERFSRIVETLGLQVVRAIMTLFAFLPILWNYSNKVEADYITHIPEIPIWLIGIFCLILLFVLYRIGKNNTQKQNNLDGDFKASLVDKFSCVQVIFFVSILILLRSNTGVFVEGSLVWVALIVSLGGMYVSWLVGVKLPGLEYNNQVKEAAYRQNLELISTQKIDYHFPKLVELFAGVRVNYRRLYLHYGYFDLWVYFYDVSMSLVPYLVMAPSLFTGVITLGAMMQIANAFDKVHASFSLFIHRWTTITELRSIWKRLHEFEANLRKHETREGK